jgi:hypothetical protein
MALGMLAAGSLAVVAEAARGTWCGRRSSTRSPVSHPSGGYRLENERHYRIASA